MKKALEDILKRNKITGRAATPSTPELFSIDAESQRTGREISFRSGKHKLFGK
jgi:hypothetical protein